jgi:hypothetical protein
VKRSSVVSLVCAMVTLSGTAFADGVFNTSSTPASPSGGAAAPAVSAVKGSMLISANGSRLAQVYRVGADGSAQIIIDGKLVTVPASTLSVSGGKLTTSLTKSEVLALH